MAFAVTAGAATSTAVTTPTTRRRCTGTTTRAPGTTWPESSGGTS